MLDIENQFSPTPRGYALLALMRRAQERAAEIGVPGRVLFEAIAMQAGQPDGLRAGFGQLHRMARMTLKNTRSALDRLERAELVTIERKPPVLVIRANLDMSIQREDGTA